MLKTSAAQIFCMKHFLKQAWVAWLLMPVLFSCATYNHKMAAYYDQVRAARYKHADHMLERNGYLQQPRNSLLYYMERGRMLHLQGLYDSSNLFLNLADHYIEERHKTVGNTVTSLLLNPMTTPYTGEDFERFMLHYYKALNYLYLGKTDDAVVEARRINLSTQAQEDKFKPGAKRYTKDAFALNVQGMLYEAAGMINDAFIAYRNAADIYLTEPNNIYYGVALPTQLKQDVLRTASQMGFNDQLDFYEKKFNAVYKKTDSSAAGGELVVFFERGMAPAKTEQNFILTQSGDGSGIFLFTGPYGSFDIPFDFSAANLSRSSTSLRNFITVRVAIPIYEPRSYHFAQGNVLLDSSSYRSESAEDINTIAPEILKERIVKEVSNALLRQVVKMGVERGASEAARAVAKNNSKEKDEAKKERDAEAAALVTGMLVNVFNTVTEKADTRNWQSLPASIQYVRIPLKKGSNDIRLQLGSTQKTIRVEGRGGLQLYNWCVTE